MIEFIRWRVCINDGGGYEYDLFWGDDVLTSAVQYATPQEAEIAARTHLRACEARLARIPAQEGALRRAAADEGITLTALPGVHVWLLENAEGKAITLWANPLQELGWASSEPTLPAGMALFGTEPESDH